MALLLWLFSLLTDLSNNLTLLGIFLTIFILSFDFMKRRRCWSRYPPGPASFPFIGTMLQIDFKNPHLSFTWLSKKYGNIYSLQNCWQNMVVVNGFKAVKEALFDKSDDFADRPFYVFYGEFSGGENNQGLIIAKYGHEWKELKRFTVSTLRNFGMGKKSLEQVLIKEAEQLCSTFSSKEGCPFDPHHLINNAVGNAICFLLLGKRFDYEDQKFQKIQRMVEGAVKEEAGVLPELLHAMPFLVHIPGIFQKAFQHQKILYDSLDEILKAHKETWKASCRRGFIDAFLEEIDKRKDNKNSLLNDKNLLLVIGDLFTAGTETTSTTLRWGLLYMILYPNVQSRVQEEIDTVIGKNRPPKMKDYINMPYTCAVINEIQRFGNIVPIGLPHMTYRDTELQGFFIPKGTTVVLNLSSVLKDETMWKYPHQFYPEHFLDSNGQFVKQAAFLPFSAGYRVCAGEQLAKMELFLFFTSLLQNFTFRVSENQPRPREDGLFTLTLVPNPYQLQAVSR